MHYKPSLSQQYYTISGIRQSEYHRPPQNKNSFKNRSNYWARNYWEKPIPKISQPQNFGVLRGGPKFRKPPQPPEYLIERQPPIIQQSHNVNLAVGIITEK